MTGEQKKFSDVGKVYSLKGVVTIDHLKEEEKILPEPHGLPWWLRR